MHLEKTLKLLSEHQLVLSKNKCSLLVKKLEYLGCIISTVGVVTNLKKIQCLVDWPQPRDIKELRGFPAGHTRY